MNYFAYKMFCLTNNPKSKDTEKTEKQQKKLGPLNVSRF